MYRCTLQYNFCGATDVLLMAMDFDMVARNELHLAIYVFQEAVGRHSIAESFICEAALVFYSCSYYS